MLISVLSNKAVLGIAHTRNHLSYSDITNKSQCLLFHDHEKNCLNIFSRDKSVSEFHETTESKLLSVLGDLLAYFLGINAKSQQDSWAGLLSLVFQQLLDLSEAKFKVTIPVLYLHICDILTVQISTDLRQTLCKILKRIGKVYRIVSEEDSSISNSNSSS